MTKKGGNSEKLPLYFFESKKKKGKKQEEVIQLPEEVF